MSNYDFSGYATRNDLLCQDGRTIRQNAFVDNDGCEVPLVWNHEHNDPNAVLGHAVLENRKDGVYAYGIFNDTEQGQMAKKLVQKGDVKSLSIWANQLKQIGNDVIHGNIRELSLVLAGANPGAYVDFVMAHSVEEEDTLYASYDENIMLYHSADESEKKEDKQEMADNAKSQEDNSDDKIVEDVINTMNEEQKNVLYTLIGMAREDRADDEDEKGGNGNMKHNVFDNEDDTRQSNVLSHSDEQQIISLAKQTGVGSLKAAMEIFAEESGTLAHGVFGDETEKLFPEYELLKKGEPETLERDQSWIGHVISGIHKSPISRIRTRQADARIAELRAKGYQKKGSYKQEMADIKLIGRTTDPQTIFIKADMHRDDITDIVDFDVVGYQWRLMRHILDEELALAALIGDSRDEADPDKIHEEHIRSIWNDNDLYCIHQSIDYEEMKTKLNGTNTGANFGEEYIKAEATIAAALYAREKYKGSGSLDYYCTPHALNVMLLARDLNGRRIYSSKADLAAALNVENIYTVEQFEGKTREVTSGGTKKLVGLFVNLGDYQFGSTKGGEITKFDDFDMDFNRYKYMLETRLSGSLTKLYSAIALEEDA